ncbi:hypothetical protein [Sutterella sp.]|uniref:hypothetical protein n=1 Tax=Sutterella sp. TaxID=1981025 RepID=UPI0026DEB4EB|nr:hypothetical protein [Sutterella sp.]MDO5531211.1 hypothetical protein [Sutterella sp.]
MTTQTTLAGVIAVAMEVLPRKAADATDITAPDLLSLTAALIRSNRPDATIVAAVRGLVPAAFDTAADDDGFGYLRPAEAALSSLWQAYAVRLSLAIHAVEPYWPTEKERAAEEEALAAAKAAEEDFGRALAAAPAPAPEIFAALALEMTSALEERILEQRLPVLGKPVDTGRGKARIRDAEKPTVPERRCFTRNVLDMARVIASVPTTDAPGVELLRRAEREVSLRGFSAELLPETPSGYPAWCIRLAEELPVEKAGEVTEELSRFVIRNGLSYTWTGEDDTGNLILCSESGRANRLACALALHFPSLITVEMASVKSGHPWHCNHGCGLPISGKRVITCRHDRLVHTDAADPLARLIGTEAGKRGDEAELEALRAV